MTGHRGISGILLDIEGTTTPIRFVHEVLFPFAARRYAATCAAAEARPDVAAALMRLREEWEGDADDPGRPDFGDGAAYAAWLTGQDRKSTGLKELQGIIWREGYETGALRAPLFDDVPDALRAWRRAGIRLRIFSSGSVLAQRLLFGHTEHGDLTDLFEGFHDTKTGPKRNASSYRAIAEAFGLSPECVLFLSDVVPELDAAAEAGMRTGLLVRPGNAPASAGRHPVHRDFRKLAAND